MNEISPEEAEAIIEAAANGASLEGHRDLGELLNALNSPVSTADHAPPVIAPPDSITGRIMRRTAVAASSAVLGLATVAAATTGAPALLDPILGDDAVVVIAAGEEGASDGETGNDEGGEDAAEDTDDEGADSADADERERPEQAQGPKEGHESGAGEAKGPDREIEGVDPSDGLDDEELMVACEAVDNHGHYVSLVARDKITETDGTHGERVSEAAQSDCGKDADDEGEAEAGEEPEEAVEPEEDAEDPETEPGENGRNQGQGQGKGHRESNGKGHDSNNGNGNGNGVGNGHAKYDDNGE